MSEPTKVKDLSEAEITRGRGTGNTTRQVDLAIQLLFSGYKVEVKDHYNGGELRAANENLFDRILRRLSMEHHLRNESGSMLVDANRRELTIEFKYTESETF